MKKIVLFAALTAMGLASTAIADVLIEDTDGNGSFSLAEMQAVYSELSEEQFVALDTDESGELSEDELKAAMDAELLPK
ncbi:EF-hand domain-containing protein [Cognatishimia activa]|uniref:EF-hand domain-containing protein n=1 Tax=Cognatishimia activa TaxID=1715691 RepID=UPI00222FB6AA|nr:EF-hand domain-containing protein [Cognatishimia activa]UZD92454.1 EF-hand domain-containing protein [Cognatishimia activa]